MTKFSNLISRFVATFVMLTTIFGALIATSLVFTPAQVQAQQSCGNGIAGRLPSFGSNCIGGLSGVSGDRQGISNIIVSIANFAIFILGAISVLYIVYGGFLYVTDDGSGTNAGKGKKIIIYALIGLIVAVASFTIVSFVINIVSTTDVGSASAGGGGGGGNRPTMINLL